MSADLLRRAAAKLREHAEAATRNMGSSAWKVEVFNSSKGYPQRVTNDRATLIAECFEGGGQPTFAPYIALMHPPVARALATAFDDMADRVESHPELRGVPDLCPCSEVDGWHQLLNAASAVLREETS